jgi:hypothetical protein
LENIVAGLAVKDPSIINDPEWAQYRAIDAKVNPYIDVKTVDDKEEIGALLESRYGINVRDWFDNFNDGMNDGKFTPARPR